MSLDPSSRPSSEWRRVLSEYVGLLLALAALVIVFSRSSQNFFSAGTFQTIANQIPAALLLATAMTYVLVIAEIDLSVGSVLGWCGAVLGVAMTQWHWPLTLALPATLAAGLFCGAFNGLVSTQWRLPSFIVTLGMLEMARGGAHAVTHSQTQYIGQPIGGLAETTLLGLSLPFLIAVLVAAAAHLILTRTVFGRYMIAVGTNEEAVRLSGINPRPIKVAVFLIAGALVGLAAIIDTSRFQSANPNAGTGFELLAIAAAVIGGTSLMGGRGSILSTVFGVLIIAVLNSGLNTLGAKDEAKRLVTGAVIVGAVIVDQYRQRLAQGHFLALAWRGQQPLWKMFWLWALGGGAAWGAVLFALERLPWDLQKLWVNLWLLIGLAFCIWILVSVWRCARHAVPVWRILARLWVAGSASLALFQLLSGVFRSTR
jgi:ribose transport system permease protein